MEDTGRDQKHQSQKITWKTQSRKTRKKEELNAVEKQHISKNVQDAKNMATIGKHVGIYVLDVNKILVLPEKVRNISMGDIQSILCCLTFIGEVTLILTDHFFYKNINNP